MENGDFLQEYFQTNIGRKIRIFKLGWKNNILIKIAHGNLTFNKRKTNYLQIIFNIGQESSFSGFIYKIYFSLITLNFHGQAKRFDLQTELFSGAGIITNNL